MQYLNRIIVFFKNMFASKQPEPQPTPPTPLPSEGTAAPPTEAELKTAPQKLKLAYNGTLKTGKWAKTITLPAVGRFVCESHYATSADMYGSRLFPNSISEGIGEHLQRSLAVLKLYEPSVSAAEVYNASWKNQWTPPENGKAGQGSVGDKKPSIAEEIWQGNMMWASNGDKPKPGTKFLVEANGRKCVIQMGYETGPGEESFLGGLVPEVHWYLKTNNSSMIKLSYLADQKIPLGPVTAKILPFKPGTTVQPTATPWMDIARSQIGTKEISGSNDNPKIVEYHQAATLKAKDDETAWCSSFACWVLEKAGYDHTHNAWARSFLDYGIKLDAPKYGCIVVYRRGADSGHVHFFDHEKDGVIYGIGGNQDNMVNIKGYGKGDVLGYRWPVK